MCNEEIYFTKTECIFCVQVKLLKSMQAASASFFFFVSISWYEVINNELAKRKKCSSIFHSKNPRIFIRRPPFVDKCANEEWGEKKLTRSNFHSNIECHLQFLWLQFPSPLFIKRIMPVGNFYFHFVDDLMLHTFSFIRSFWISQTKRHETHARRFFHCKLMVVLFFILYLLWCCCFCLCILFGWCY